MIHQSSWHQRTNYVAVKMLPNCLNFCLSKWNLLALIEYLLAETKKFAKAWRTHRAVKLDDQNASPDKESTDGKESSEVCNNNINRILSDYTLQDDQDHDPKWKTILKSLAYLLFGVAMVTIFSNPMVDALSSLTSKDNTKFYSTSGRHGQYIPIPGMFKMCIIV